VSDIMRSGADVPQVAVDASFSDLMREMSAKGIGASAVTDAGGRLCGIFTDGDLRRLVETGVDLRSVRAGEVMRSKPFTVSPHALAAEAANLMEERKISSVLVLDAQGVLCGALTSNDLMRAKVI